MVGVLSGCGHLIPGAGSSNQLRELDPLAGETHFDHLEELTLPGVATRAHWSFDGSWLAFLYRNPGGSPPVRCNQVYRVRVNGRDAGLVSQGSGRTDSPSYFPDDSRIIYTSSLPYSSACPMPLQELPAPANLISLDRAFQLLSSRPDGSDTLALEPGGPRAYNNNAAICADGSVVFVSDREGDPALYFAKLDPMGSILGIRRITHGPGFYGDPVLSADCRHIAWTAWHPAGPRELTQYKANLKKHRILPDQLEIWMADSDGSHSRQVTSLGAWSRSPTFTRNGQGIVFGSNYRNHRTFDLYLIKTNGAGLERVTYSNQNDTFPNFSQDGSRLVFSSARSGKEAGAPLHLMLAKWKEKEPESGPIPISSVSNPSDRFIAMVSQLDAPDMGGRIVGTAGFRWAEDFVAQRLREEGLHPFFAVFNRAPGGEGYEQEVRVATEERGTTGPPFLAHNLLGTWGNRCGKTRPVLISSRLDQAGSSGVAAMLVAARLIQARSDPDSCFVFAALTEGTDGNAGSFQLERLLFSIHAMPKAMLHVDEVGQMSDNRLMVLDAASSPSWKELISRACLNQSLSCILAEGLAPEAPLDVFLEARVPALDLTTASPGQADESATRPVNATGGAQAAQFVAALAEDAASADRILRFNRKSYPHRGRGTP